MIFIPKTTKMVVIFLLTIAIFGLPYRYYQVYKSSAGHYIRKQVENTYYEESEIKYDLNKAKSFGIVTSVLMVTGFDVLIYIFLLSIIILSSREINKKYKKKMLLFLLGACLIGIFILSKGTLNLNIVNNYFVGIGSAIFVYIAFSLVSIIIYLLIKLIQSISSKSVNK